MLNWLRWHNVRSYLLSHWRGEQPLWRSYWINGVALSLPLNVVAQEQLGRSHEQMNLWILCTVLSGALVLATWQMVGVWRSGRRVRRQRISPVWGTVAQATIVLNLLYLTVVIGVMGYAIYVIRQAADDPTLRSPFEITQDDHVVTFTGTIHDTSAARLLARLDDTDVHELVVSSRGGLTRAAAAIAERIHDRRMRVTAKDECMSACTLLLAASPAAAVMPYTTVTLHHGRSIVPEWVKQLFEPDGPSADDFYLQELAKYNVTASAIQKVLELPPDGEWTPTLPQLEAMNLVMFVYDDEVEEYMRVREYCSRHSEGCG